MNIHLIAATYWEMRKTICGLKMEKIERTQYRFVCEGQSSILHISGIGQENARRTLEKIFVSEQNPFRVISTGFACALKPEIKAGDLVLDQEKSDPAILSTIAQIAGKNGMKTHQGKFCTHSKVVMKSDEKIQLAKQTGAIALEMESQALYQLCRARGVPFCSVRAVSDTLDQNLPQAVLFLNSRGGLGPKFWKEFFSRPQDWTNFFRLTCSSNKAGTALRELFQSYLK